MSQEARVIALLDAWSAAFCSKNPAALMALYAADAVIYDAIPPFSSGVELMRAKLDDCIQYFPESFAIERRELKTLVTGEMATANFLWRFSGMPAGHPAGRHWFRSSLVLQQCAGDWKIVHDHCSAPFDPYTDKVVFDPDPAACSQPAPGTCGSRNPVGWFEIYVQDMVRAKAFYQAVFGFEFTQLASPIELWAFPMLPGGQGISGALAKIDGLESGGNSVLVYFSSLDCAQEAARAVAAGGQLCKPKFSIGQYGYIALVSDSEGNMIGLHSLQ